MRTLLLTVGSVVLIAQVFALGFLVGAGRGIDMVRRDAIAEGYAVRDEGGEFRWKASSELERRRRVRDGENARRE